MPPYFKSKDGKLIGSEEVISERWKDHFEENLTEGIEQPSEERKMVDEEIPEPTVEEIEIIIQ